MCMLFIKSLKLCENDMYHAAWCSVDTQAVFGRHLDYHSQPLVLLIQLTPLSLWYKYSYLLTYLSQFSTTPQRVSYTDNQWQLNNKIQYCTMYTVRQKTASFYFCNNFVKSFFIWITIDTHISDTFGTKWHQNHLSLLKGVFIMPCKMQHTYTCYD